MSQATESDSTGISPYEIDGYNWKLSTGREIAEGTLIPGHVGEVYELVVAGGYSADLSNDYFAGFIVFDGKNSGLPRVRTDERHAFNVAAKERFGMFRFNPVKRYWTLTPKSE